MPAAGLKEQGRGLTASAAWLRAGKFVVVGQLALSLPLLVGAGLLLRTFHNLQQVDLGYAKERLLMVEVDVQTAGYEESRRLALFQRLLERVRAVPGVRAATYSKNGLFLGPEAAMKSSSKDIRRRAITTGARGMTTSDRITSRRSASRCCSAAKSPNGISRPSNRVCVINEAFAKRFFAGRNPLGMHVTQFSAISAIRLRLWVWRGIRVWEVCAATSSTDSMCLRRSRSLPLIHAASRSGRLPSRPA